MATSLAAVVLAWLWGLGGRSPRERIRAVNTNGFDGAPVTKAFNILEGDVAYDVVLLLMEGNDILESKTVRVTE